MGNLQGANTLSQLPHLHCQVLWVPAKQPLHDAVREGSPKSTPPSGWWCRCQRVPQGQPRWLQQTQEPLEKGLQRLQLGQEPLSLPCRRGPLFDTQSPLPTLASYFLCVGNALSCALHMQLRDNFFSCPTLRCLCPGTAAAMRRWL